MSHWQDEIRSRLFELRGAIRRYLALEGLAVVAVLVGAWFWLTYLVDVGYFGTTRLELPKIFRTFALVGGIGLIAGVGLRWLVTRVLRPLRMDSLALLLESRHPEFNGRLMSALHSHTPAGSAATMMAERNEREAADRLRDVEVLDVLNPQPLRQWSFAAGAVIVSVVLFGVTNLSAMGRWTDAYIFGKQGYWDRFRQTDLQLVLVRQPGDVEVPFVDGRAKHARGAHLSLLAVVPEGRKSPRRVTLTVRSAGSENDSIDQDVPMTPSGDGRFRHTVLRVSDDVEISLAGGDYTTTKPYYVNVVDPPQVDSVVLECTYPEYTGLNTDASREVPVQSSVTELPYGTRFTLRSNTNKPIETVILGGEDATRSAIDTGKIGNDNRQWSIDGFVGDIESASGIGFLSGRPIEILLRDTDGLTSQEPIELTFTAKADNPPIVAVQTTGISSSVTRQARIPFLGSIVDDYALNESWFDFGVVDGNETSEQSKQLLDVDVENRREVELNPAIVGLDLRPLGMAIGEKLRLAIASSDANDLTGPGIGRSDTTTLTIVSDEELLALLYDKELNLRKRFEDILDEVRATRDDIGLATEKAEAGGDTEVWNQVSAATEQAVLAVRKNETETRSIIALFEDVRAEMVNNRVDSADKLDRIDQGIVGPLERIIDGDFPDAEQRLISVRETTRGDVNFDAAVRPLGSAEQQLQRLVTNLEAVLAEMQRRQSFNESIERLMKIIEMQKDLKKKTDDRNVDNFFGDDSIFE